MFTELFGLNETRFVCALFGGITAAIITWFVLRRIAPMRASCSRGLDLTWGVQPEPAEPEPEPEDDPVSLSPDIAPNVRLHQPARRIVRSPLLTQWDEEVCFRIHIEQAAAGMVNGTLADWPALAKSLAHYKLHLPLATPASVVRGVCLRLLAAMPDEEIKKDFLGSAL